MGRRQDDSAHAPGTDLLHRCHHQGDKGGAGHQSRFATPVWVCSELEEDPHLSYNDAILPTEGQDAAVFLDQVAADYQGQGQPVR